MNEKRLALIIATDQYEDTGLRQLVAPAQDADALARVLGDSEIGGFEVQTIVNEISNRIRQEIDAFFADIKRDDLVLLYFSCHGIKDQDGQLYFAATDTKRKLLLSTAISANFVNEVIRRGRSRRQILLLDCCYSGAFARGMRAKADKGIGTKERFEGLGRAVLTASDAMQYAFEGDQVKGKDVHSVFTSSLIQGLETGEADLDGDGCITLDELYDYVYDRVVDKEPEQKPEKWNFGIQGQIIIARNPKPVLKPAELSSELQRSIKDIAPWVREGAARQLGRLLHGADKGLALSAHAALMDMEDDDSRQVSTVVAEILKAYTKVQGVAEDKPEAERPVEKKVEVKPKTTEKAKEKHLEQELPEPKEKLSYWKAVGWHFLFGFGLFYVDKNLLRKHVYPCFPFYALFDLILATSKVRPFRGDFGGITFLISLVVYGLSFIDVILTCRIRRGNPTL